MEAETQQQEDIIMNQVQTIESNSDQMFNLTTNMDMIGYFPLENLRDNSSTTVPTDPHQTEDHQMRYLSSTSRDQGYYGKSLHSIQPVLQMMNEEFLRNVSNLHIHQHGLHQFQLIRNSKYLKPAQELLYEFCGLGTKQSENHEYCHQKKTSKQKVQGVNQWDNNEHAGTSSNANPPRNHNLYSLELLELHKRKAQLMSMREEVFRRYKHYCDQMKAVVSSFEEAAGNGAATVYSALASKAMSRHFRCLRDGIIEQLQATKKALGEKNEHVALGTTRGETPRLRLLDQTLRQHKAFQQLNMMEIHPWRPQRGLPERSVSVLRAWLFEHFLHPYPTDVDKHILARQTGLSRSQVSNWFINARVRLWKPMVEEMYMEETKEELENTNTSNNLIASTSDNNGLMSINDHMSHAGIGNQFEDEKPTPDQLIRIDSDCLSSIINQNNSYDKVEAAAASSHSHILHHNSNSVHPFGAYSHTSNAGPTEMDFSSYNPSHNFGRASASGVSLTLGLQQHGENGVSLAFHHSGAGGGSHASLFYGPGRDTMDACQTMQYSSVMDGDHGQNLPCRNLIGAQLLHDFAG